MNIANIKYNDIANGEGVRTTVFVSGCSNKCPGCFQPQTWDKNYGTPYTPDIEEKILKSLESKYCQGITFLGGEPFEPYNQEEISKLILKIRELYPDKNIWMFTGFVYDRDLTPGGKRYIDTITDSILDNIDVLVDGPFVLEKKNLMLRFRGSENQRIIDMKESKSSGSIVLIDFDKRT